jgi:hypothetical protein
LGSILYGVARVLHGVAGLVPRFLDCLAHFLGRGIIVLARSERSGENREQDGEQSQTQQNVAEQGTPPYLFS